MTTEAADPAAPEPAEEAVPAAPEDHQDPLPEAATDAPSDPVTEPEPEAEPEPEPEAGAASSAAPEPDQPPAERKPRRRGKTVLIMAVAVVLGVLGGAGAGYAVQQHRAPTPLPPLAVTQPSYLAGHFTAPGLTAADDDMVKTDGDLTKLLIPIPKGAKRNTDESGDNGWLSLSDLSENFTKPGIEFQWQLVRGFRRAAVVAWDQGGTNYQVNLIQYQHSGEASPAAFLTSQTDFLATDAGGYKYRTSVPGTANGVVFAGPKQLHENDGTTYYRGGGLAVHGDIVLAVWVDSSHRIDGKALMAVVQSQLERL